MILSQNVHFICGPSLGFNYYVEEIWAVVQYKKSDFLLWKRCTRCTCLNLTWQETWAGRVGRDIHPKPLATTEDTPSHQILLESKVKFEKQPTRVKARLRNRVRLRLSTSKTRSPLTSKEVVSIYYPRASINPLPFEVCTECQTRMARFCFTDTLFGVRTSYVIESDIV